MFKTYAGIIYFGNSEMEIYLVEKPYKLKKRLQKQFGKSTNIEIAEIPPYLIPEEELDLEDLNNLYKMA